MKGMYCNLQLLLLPTVFESQKAINSDLDKNQGSVGSLPKLSVVEERHRVLLSNLNSPICKSTNKSHYNLKNNNL